ncbi:MAG: hypothetical protein AAFP09_04025, partial [Cyanobacteria bacterium J06607_10]
LTSDRVLESVKMVVTQCSTPNSSTPNSSTPNCSAASSNAQAISDTQRPVLPVADYNNPNVSTQVVRIVLSYVDYINRVIWSKS